MNVRTMIVGVLAVVCGLSAMVLVTALRKPPTGPTIEKAAVVFATADVKPGEMVLESMLEVREIPKVDVPEDAITKLSEATDRAAMTQLDRGDMVRRKKLAEKGSMAGMSSMVPKGMRAFTIQTPSFSSSLAGFILPGNKVDVLMTVTVPSEGQDDSVGTITATLLQNVDVLAVHTTVNAPVANKVDPDQARSVTLLVTPDDASLLDLGQNKGTLHLSLRNKNDVGIVKPRPTTLADLKIPGLVKEKKPEVVQAPAVVQPPPAVEPAPPVEVAAEPETVEIKLAVRTLRGTAAGQDILTLTRPASTVRRNLRPGPDRSMPAGLARASATENGGTAGGPTPRGAGPPP